MELYVNDTLIDISLSRGDTVHSLLQALEGELGSRIIATLVLDGVYSSCDSPEVLSRPLENIGKAEIIAATREELGIALISDAQNILSAASGELKNGSELHKKELTEGLEWVLESLDALRQSLPFPPADIAILHGAVADTLRFLGKDLSSSEHSELAEALENFIQPLENLKSKLANPEIHSKESVLAKLAEVKEFLPELAGYFQSGRDVEALGLLGRVIDAIEIYARFSARLPSGENRLFADELNGLSSSLLEAFENKDYVLIADIIEFDLGDQIDTILDSAKED